MKIDKLGKFIQELKKTLEYLVSFSFFWAT
ncbi:hypothetical protein BN000_04974 [Neobacillus massiliamazoniensis]|uniref:Uncharacterized protein n=1 Tax=Neobacillus massiliamazoniensis TaxID=1499688 RepID=A0A0U1P3Q6_9BACI|nr:hypothetical protein BN000_04974 [Neobacillus massiliamazoniensis]